MSGKCKQCGKPLVSTRAGSFTSYFFQQNYCHCNNSRVGAPGQSADKARSSGTSSGKNLSTELVCGRCGKSAAEKRAGSFTSFLFQELRCQCAQPALPKKVRLTRSNTQVRRQAMAEKRGYTASFKVNAESGRKIAQLDFSPGTVIGGAFKIVSVIGEGGMGIVYLAQHLSLNQPYALKILSPSIVSEQSWLRFKAEAKTLAALNHSGLVRVYDLGIHENRVPYYSMDYLEGETLEDLLVRKGAQDLEYTISIFLSVLDALAYAHRNNVVHRDIKPANIFICRNQEIKILDFGISKLLGEKHNQELTAVGEVFGSPYYMSPEQCRGEQIDFRSDIYSVGCSLFETLTGYVPYESPSSLEIAMLHEEAQIPLLSDVCDIAFPPSLDLVLDRCLAKLPQDRYQSAKEMAIDLTRIRDGKNLETYVGAPRIARSDSQADQADSKGALLLGYGLGAILALGLAGAAVFVIAFQPMVPTGKPVVDKTLATGGLRNLPRMTDVGEEMSARSHVESPQDLETMAFLEKRFKYYSQIVTKNGEKYRVFTFPAGVSLGNFYWRSEGRNHEHAASGTFELPLRLKLALKSNANVQLHPRLLNYFRSDDLKALALASEPTKVDVMLSSIAKLTSLETLSLQAMELNPDSTAYLNRLTNLKSLAFYSCKIDPAVFANLIPISKVQTLFFDGGANVSAQIKVIANNAHLESLTISSAVLSKDDLKAVSSMASLRTLSLQYSSLTNDDLKMLTALTNLRDLDISFTKVDDKCVDTLLQFHKLERLVIAHLPASSEARLRSALPHLRVIE
ncbi:MAG: eukaryotic-like serine/threonine-protein kinase [Cyanobacteriota bacterium erpe_2018_sw_21hr_WHONDRS-SW48-000092_B_bin.40]|nr:eukaryotic-like serine/threonine-protein kinase [Cyanobacteriota bacterium erpe_2018_sw_21hr_WHONDRS-SW48-000092_B_bin.40]